MSSKSPFLLRKRSEKTFGLDGSYLEKTKRFLAVSLGPVAARIMPKNLVMERPILLIGCPRSGTGVVSHVFGMHNSIAHWSEAARVWEPKHSPDVHSLEVGDASIRDIARIRGTFGLYTALSGKGYFLNKHPRNSVRLPYLRKIYPEALLVHVLRHPVATVDSLVRRSAEYPRSSDPFGRFCRPPNWKAYVDMEPVVKHSYQWKEIVEYLLDVGSGNGEFPMHCVRYEDLLHSPKNEIDKFCSYVGLTSDSSKIDSFPFEAKLSNVSLSEDQVDQVWDICGEVAGRAGYNRCVPVQEITGD